MVSPNVNKILREVQTLSDAEREELRNSLDKRAELQRNQTDQEKLQQQMLADGFLSHIPSKAKDMDRFRKWQPVPIKGKPLSETIIEERR